MLLCSGSAMKSSRFCSGPLRVTAACGTQSSSGNHAWLE